MPLCPVCGHSKFTAFASGYDYELETCGNEWHFVRCDDCEHSWLNPRPHESTLSVIYPPHYYAYDYEGRVNRFARMGKRQLDKAKFKGILKHLSRTPKNYLDVGCGSGRYLHHMHSLGLERQSIYGLEIDAAQTARLAEEQFNIINCRIEDADLPENTFDLITMFHVLEHVDDPKVVVEHLFRLLSPGGVLVIETPNIDSLDARLFSNTYWGGYHIPRHWNLFSVDSLRRTLEDSGLQVQAHRFQTGHSFWMYSFHHMLGYGVGWKRMAQLFNPFKGLPFLLGFTALDLVRSKLGFSTSAILMVARKSEPLT
ncbi:class I SAM-dependent methyltransferase [Blastopirellula marina]|uniref:class I SAM-dependent methyltransferase n=1 Tax=Blastopirellula marina TaxID=124 RepID=UPI0011AFED98|nr:class I SAM-dependent methyltransferase [Blastopirellula marina]